MTKYKINIDRPKVKADEIVQNKDFNNVLKKYKKVRHASLKTNWLVIYIIVFVVLIAVFFAVKIISDMESEGTTKKSETTKTEVNE